MSLSTLKGHFKTGLTVDSYQFSIAAAWNNISLSSSAPTTTTRSYYSSSSFSSSLRPSSQLACRNNVRHSDMCVCCQGGRRASSLISNSTVSVSLPKFSTNSLSKRTFFNSSSSLHSHDDNAISGKGGKLTITYLTPENEAIVLKVKEGSNLLDIAHANEIELEGACEGSLACSTCHLIVKDQTFYDRLEEPSDEENDMLDLAFGLTETSRLGCQIKMSKEIDNIVVQIPRATRNVQLKDN